MSTIVKFLFSPLASRKSKPNRPVCFSIIPPPVDVNTEWKFGPYSWKATVEAVDSDGVVDRTFIGFSQNMNITDRTKDACDRHKSKGTTCGEPQMAMKGGECDEVIFMKLKNQENLINLTKPKF